VTAGGPIRFEAEDAASLTAGMAPEIIATDLQHFGVVF
jgi:hypothetical protein